MKKNVLALIVGIMMVVSLIAGCSSNTTNSGANKDANNGVNSGEKPKEVSDKAVDLTMTMWGSEDEKKIYQERLDFVKTVYPNINVKLVLVAGEYDQKVQTMIAGGTAPDIMMLAENFLPYASKNQIVSLDSLISETGLDMDERYTDDVSALMQYDGQQYGLTDRAGAMVLYYNKDLFDAANVAYPDGTWTQTDLMDAAKKLTVKEGEKTVQWGYYQGSWWPQWMHIIYQNGGSLFDLNGKPTFDTDETRRALSYLNELVFTHGAGPTPAEVSDLGNIGPDPLFAQGKVAMVTTGYWNILSLASVEGINWDISPIWGETNAFFNGLTIAKDSKHQKEAFKVIEALTSIEGQMPIVKHNLDVPATKAALSSDEFINAKFGGKQFNMAAFNESKLYAPPLNPKWNEMMKVIEDKINVYFNNGATLDDTVTQIQAGLEKVYK